MPRSAASFWIGLIAGIISGLLLMAGSDPHAQLAILVYSALLVAFSSATQDIAIDAWRIEAMPVETLCGKSCCSFSVNRSTSDGR